MAEWEKLWRCKNCKNWNDDFRLTCVKYGKSKLNACGETAYRCKNVDISHPPTAGVIQESAKFVESKRE